MERGSVDWRLKMATKDKQWKWRSWHYSNYNAAKVAKEFKQMQSKYGVTDMQLLAPDIIVKEARTNKKLELHKMFQWDVRKAAQAHWETQARAIMRNITEVIVIDEEPIEVHGVIHVVDGDASGYTTFDAISRDKSDKIIQDALDGLQSWMSRYAELAIRIPGLHPSISNAIKILLSAVKKHEKEIRKAVNS